MKMQLRGLSDVLDAAVLGPFRSGGRHGTDALLGALILPAGLRGEVRVGVFYAEPGSARGLAPGDLRPGVGGGNISRRRDMLYGATHRSTTSNPPLQRTSKI